MIRSVIISISKRCLVFILVFDISAKVAWTWCCS